MADETKIIKIEVEGTSDVDKASSSVNTLSTSTKKYGDTVKDVSPALDKLTGGAVSFAEGAQKMTKSALGFIATPIGAVVGALGLALGSLIAYFKGSEEGQNKWNKIVAIGSTLLEKLMDVAENVGGFLVNMFENPKKALQDFGNFLVSQLLNRFTGILELIPKVSEAIGLLFEGKFSEAATVAGDAVGKVLLGVEGATQKIIDFANEVVATTETAIAQGQRLADLQASLDSNERDLIVKRAQTNLEVAKLREQAIKQEGDAKKETIYQAIALEKELANAELLHAQMKLEQAQLELEANGADKEAKLAVANAQAAVISADAQRYESTLRFSKEIEKIDDAEAARKKKNADDVAKANEKAAKESRDTWEAMFDGMEKAYDKQLADDKKKREADAEAQKKLTETKTQFELGALDLVTGKKGAARQLGTALLKKDALKEIGVNTQKAAIGAYNALASIPIVGPALGALAAAAVIAYGAVRAANVAGVTFATGGYTGDGGKYEAAGIVHKGEFVIPKETVQAFGPDYFASKYLPQYADGGLVTNQAVEQTNVQFAILDIIRKMPNPVVGVKEITEGINAVAVKQAIVSSR